MYNLIALFKMGARMVAMLPVGKQGLVYMAPLLQGLCLTDGSKITDEVAEGAKIPLD